MPDKLSTEIIINERISKIEEVVVELKKLRQMTEKEFMIDKRSQYAAMYGMIAGIEAICDIGNHILARYFNQPVETYKDIILSLGEEGIISKSFAKRSAKMTDFRNILIHFYLKLDVKEVYKNLQKAPEEYTKFCRYFLNFLSK